MKNLIVLNILIYLFLIDISAQVNDSVDINYINALISADGLLFFDDTGFEPVAHFYVPSPEPGEINASTILASGLWIGGIDEGDQLHMAAQTYRQSGNDFWPGPVAVDYGSGAYTATYDHVWVENKADIDEHKLHWSDLGYVVPDAIMNWPGNGNTVNGEAEFIAPFYDYNVNSIYDPENGDYPIIRGDEALFFLFNDAANLHSESGGEKLGIEVHGMAYEFAASPLDTALYQTLFVHYEIINRSVNTYNNLFAGLYADFDNGCYADDWVGCDSVLNLFYGFNGDNYDNCEPSFGVDPPSQGITLLNEKLYSFMLDRNDFTTIGNPEEPSDYYNYLQALWKDSTHLTYGGNGYGGADNTNYMYPSDPLDPAGWSESTESTPGSDVRGIGASGPFILGPGESLCLDFAFPFADRDSTDYYGSIAVLKERTQDIIDFYNSSFSSCVIENEINPDYIPSAIEQELITGTVVSPNPVHDVLLIKTSSGIVFNAATLNITNAAGQKIAGFTDLNGSSIKLSGIHFAPGLYFYEISDVSGYYSAGNFIAR